MLIEGCMVLSSFFQLLTFVHQVQYNKHKKSIYGLSCDYMIFACLYYVVSTITTINYYINPLIIKQIEERFPTYPDTFVSLPILLVDIIGVVVVSGILIQIYFLYPTTKNINQSLSELAKILLVPILMVITWVTYCCVTGQSALYLLDLIDTFWFFSKLIDLSKLTPQLCMNWFGSCVIGLSDHFLLDQWMSIFFLALGKVFMLHEDFYYFEIPVNYNTWCYLIFYSASLLLYTFQQKNVYHGAIPSLPMKHNPENEDANV